MTISTSENSQIVAGTGLSYAFDFGFVGDALQYLSVTYIDALGNTTLLNPSQYSIVLTTPGPNQLWGIGGVVTYPLSGPPIASGTYLSIQRILPYTQETTVRNQGNYYPVVTEKALDTLEMQIQQVAADVVRSIQIPATDAQGTNVVLPPAQVRANQGLVFDSQGNVALGTIGSVSGVISVPHGGTGLSALPSGGVLIGNGTASPTFAAPGSSGFVLTSNGISSAFSALNVGTPPVGLLWPAYIYPANISMGVQGLDIFNAFMTLMATYPKVPVTVIVSPPFDGLDSNYASIISRLVTAGAKVVAYIYTVGATRPIGDVEAQAAGILSFYPLIQGFFVDQMNPDPANIAYYRTLRAYIASLRTTLYVVANGGVNYVASYYDGTVADLLVCYENSNGGFPTLAQASNSGLGTRNQRAAIVANQAFDSAGFSIMTTSCGSVWLSDTSPFVPPFNAYGALPTYLASIFQILTSLAEASATQGVLSPDNGGLGLADPTANNILMGNGNQSVKLIPPTVSGDIVTCDGVTFSSQNPVGIGNFQPVGMLVPAYVYPNPTTYFDAYIEAMSDYPNVPMIFALTPAYTGGADANYTAEIAALQAAGARVVLVVDVVNGTLALATAEARAATLQGYYPTIDGIIIVGMPNTTGAPLTYTQSLYTYIKSTLNMKLVVGDPGTTTPAQYFDGSCADIIIVSSTTGSYPNASQASNAGVGTKSQLSVLVDQTAYSASGFALMAKYCAWVYANDAVLPAPPTTLDTMFSALETLDLPPALTIPAKSIVCNPLSYSAPAGALTGTANQIPRINASATGLSFTSDSTPTVVVTGTTQAMVANVAYSANNAALVTLTLPATFAVGDEFIVMGLGSGGWKIAQNASQLIRFNASATTTGVGGSLASVAQYNNVHLKAMVANTTLTVLSNQGALTVV